MPNTSKSEFSLPVRFRQALSGLRREEQVKPAPSPAGSLTLAGSVNRDAPWRLRSCWTLFPFLALRQIEIDAQQEIRWPSWSRRTCSCHASQAPVRR